MEELLLSLYRNEEGGLTLEAALILPLFLAFLFAIVCMVRIAVVETALHASVSETVKVVSTHMYPVMLLYNDAEQKWQNSSVGRNVNEWLDKVRAAKEKAEKLKGFADDYAAFIPDSLLPLLTQLIEREESVEHQVSEQTENLRSQTVDPLLNSAFTPLVRMYADGNKLKSDTLRVSKVTLPDLKNKDDAYFGLEATYTLKLPIPFFQKEIKLKASSCERVWIGA